METWGQTCKPGDGRDVSSLSHQYIPSTTYAWDYENRLTSVTLPGSGGTVAFKYDPFGRRIYKSSSSSTSVFAYDGDNLIEETNASGTAVARYSQGLNIDEPLAMLRGGTTSFYNADGLGSITSLANSSGSLAQTYTFDSFGKQTSSSGSLTNPFQYTARESDPETGLYYYRARYYDPGVGRFIREDPARFTAGVNFYEYVRNSPLYFADPWGLCRVELRFAPLGIGLYDHAYLVVRDNNFPLPYYIRGGPEHGHSSGDSSGASTAGSSGSSGSNLGWGPLIGQMGAYQPHTPDWDPGEPISQVLLDDSSSCACVVRKMADFTNSVNNSKIPYNPFSANSNAFAYGAARAAGLNPGTPPVPVPGHDKNLLP
jgi:RHS repeat-associated protein